MTIKTVPFQREATEAVELLWRLSDLTKEIEALTPHELRLKNARDEIEVAHGKLKALLRQGDLASPGNTGFESRFTWFLRTVRDTIISKAAVPVAPVPLPAANATGMYVSILFIRERSGVVDAEVLLALRVDETKGYPHHWSTAGGSVEPGETLVAAALRETHEESGLRVGAERLQYVGESLHHDEQSRPFVMHAFHLRLMPSEVPMCTEPKKQDRWVSFADVSQLVMTPGTIASLRLFPPIAASMKAAEQDFAAVLNKQAEGQVLVFKGLLAKAEAELATVRTELSMARNVRDAVQQNVDGALREIERLRREIERRDVELRPLREAVGLMTTLKPSMEMRAHDPVGMAQEVITEVEVVKRLAVSVALTEAARIVRNPSGPESEDGYNLEDLASRIDEIDIVELMKALNS